MRRLNEMTRKEAERRLRAGESGRVAFAAPDGPHIVPVNYVIVDDTLVIRTTPYSLLGAHGRDAVIAMEIDAIDPEHQAGWSVVIRGRAATTHRSLDGARLRLPESQPWAPGRRTLHLHLSLTDSEITGRVLEALPVQQT